MATVTLKLYSLLARHLPAGAQANACAVSVDEGATVGSVISGAGLPNGLCHLVLLNGTYVVPAARDAAPVAAGDTLAIWPPVAGG